MTALEKMRDFVASYPGHDILARLDVDYTDKVPNAAGLFPSGLVEVSRTRDILGDVTVDDQLNFALYTTLEKYEDGTDNAEWQLDFQQWVQEQSALGLAPTFGDDPRTERIQAQNGQLYSTDEEGTALYAIQISVNYTKKLRR
jgi:hypothetical protein